MVEIESLWDFTDPEASEARFRAAIESAEDRLDQAEIRTQVARTLGLRGRFEEAENELALAAQDIGETPTRAKTRLLLEKGRCLNSSGKPADAVPLFEHAVETAQRCGEPGLEVDAIHMLAIADPEHSLEWNLKGIQMAESSNDPRAQRWRASLYNNTGWSYWDTGDKETALAYFEKAVPLREAMGDQRNLDTAWWTVAFALRGLGRTAEAFPIVERLVAANPDEPHTNQEVALCLAELGRAEEAAPYAARAYAAFKDDAWMLANRGEIVAALSRLANV